MLTGKDEVLGSIFCGLLFVIQYDDLGVIWDDKVVVVIRFAVVLASTSSELSRIACRG